MNILVINAGSSSLKYQLFDMDRGRILASGLAEKIGEESGALTSKTRRPSGEMAGSKIQASFHDHHQALDRIISLLRDPENGVIRDLSDISAVGHRVVHGGETFRKPTLITADVIAAIKENVPLAPLHNPPNLMGIEVTQKLLPSTPQVAVFDTAFHQTLPARAFLYAIPYELYEDSRVRRYGFHGTSHAYVAGLAADYLDRPLEELALITIHLGNGASMAAIKGGKCLDTSMGMTPLEGLVMGTRSGDIDPALPFFLADHLGMSLKEIDRLLNSDSGLKGLCGVNDMREALERRSQGDERASVALEVYAYRIKKYIGAYTAALGRLDALVFTAGIGENSPQVRKQCLENMDFFGIELDEAKNESRSEGVLEINGANSRVKVLVVPTNEELRIAQETQKVIEVRAALNPMRAPFRGAPRASRLTCVSAVPWIPPHCPIICPGDRFVCAVKWPGESERG